MRELLENIYELTKCEDLKSLLSFYSLELGLLEDVYITSKYVVRDFNLEEIDRLKEVVDKVIEIVKRCVDKESFT